MKLEDYNKDILESMVKRFASVKAAEDLFKKSVLEDILFMGYKPLTKWQKFKYKMQDLKQRCKDIWTILIGGDIHKDCGY